jgi:hypothetical protein
MRLIALILIASLIAGCTTQNPVTQGPTQIQIIKCQDSCGDTGPAVCGTDGETYRNRCSAECFGAKVAMTGDCTAAAGGCSDSDGGKDVFAKGTAVTGSKTATDRCMSADSVYEFYCDNGAIANQTLACPAGYGCNDGACVKSGAGAGCSDTDGDDIYTKGVVTAPAGTYEDSCVDAGSVKEYVCAGDSVSSKTDACPEGYGCESGRCFKKQATCIETDGGNDIYHEGMITITNALVSAEYLDKCIDGSTLKEYYCTGDGYTSQTVKCPEGYSCIKAACLEAVCQDSDDGYSIYIGGFVKKGSNTYYDKCAGTTTGIEYYCQDNQVKNAQFDCPQGDVCRDGACVG